MKLAIVNHKGGTGKTTTAVHLAAYLNTLAPTLLLDGDGQRSALAWSKRGKGFPYRVAGDEDAKELTPQFTHTVLDTAQGEGPEDLRAVFGWSDLIVIPTVPASLDTYGLGRTLNSLRQLGPDKFRVLVTKSTRDAAREIAELRGLLAGSKTPVPVLTAEIPLLKAYAKAAAAGEIVSQTKDKHAGRAWEAYAAAGKEITA